MRWLGNACAQLSPRRRAAAFAALRQPSWSLAETRRKALTGCRPSPAPNQGAAPHTLGTPQSTSLSRAPTISLTSFDRSMPGSCGREDSGAVPAADYQPFDFRLAG